MNNKEQEKDTSSSDLDKDNIPNDYNLLLQKLLSIKSIINLLEKNYLDKETEIIE
tara:strand:- start:170 stop:334 length:165 start_codon:yes stop_codon:yes gene_type:complete